jgi:hypothetical protein
LSADSHNLGDDAFDLSAYGIYEIDGIGRGQN